MHKKNHFQSLKVDGFIKMLNEDQLKLIDSDSIVIVDQQFMATMRTVKDQNNELTTSREVLRKDLEVILGAVKVLVEFGKPIIEAAAKNVTKETKEISKYQMMKILASVLKNGNTNIDMLKTLDFDSLNTVRIKYLPQPLETTIEDVE